VAPVQAAWQNERLLKPSDGARAGPVEFIPQKDYAKGSQEGEIKYLPKHHVRLCAGEGSKGLTPAVSGAPVMATCSFLSHQ